MAVCYLTSMPFMCYRIDSVYTLIFFNGILPGITFNGIPVIKCTWVIIINSTGLFLYLHDVLIL